MVVLINLTLEKKSVTRTCFAPLKAGFGASYMFKTVCLDTETRVKTGLSLVVGYDMILSNKQITTALIRYKYNYNLQASLCS